MSDKPELKINPAFQSLLPPRGRLSQIARTDYKEIVNAP